MVPAGDPTEHTVGALLNVLSAGDTIIDGGNSNCKDTVRRAAKVAEKGLHFVDVGTSGGVWGLAEGYSLMVGGEEAVVERLRPVFETLAPAPEVCCGTCSRTTCLMFPQSPGDGITPNVLSLCLQPDEGVHLRFEAKEPGAGMRTRSVDMEFHYAEDFGASALPDAYERLLLDAMQADASLFARADEIELAWSLVDPILAGWERPDTPPLVFYEPGSWGPAEADDLLARDGRAWQYGCGAHGEGG